MLESGRGSLMKCASCGSARVYPSRLRNTYERLREILTGRQPHRCHACGMRTWRIVEILENDDAETTPGDLRTGHDPAPVKPTELDDLDPIRSRR
jgi:hypothetical protein